MSTPLAGDVGLPPNPPAAAPAPPPVKRTLLRLVLLTLSVLLTAGATGVFVDLALRDGLQIVDVPLTLLFVVLFFWIAFSFCTAMLGFFQHLRTSRHSLFPLPRKPMHRDPSRPLPKSALVMPIYNEDPLRVFAGLRAMHRSLQEVGRADRFDLFVLSDTTDPDVWLQEELAWTELKQSLPADANVFYRRREKNLHRKSGNIEDFCRRFGDRYVYMIVLDADSVMDGGVLVEMVQRMEDDDHIGILQVPPIPVGRLSLFARLQQFAARVYGDIFATGFTLWTHHDGNYFGHNAIIRVDPFMRHCGLPKLPGRPPLGGEILSHDFVEAALIRRAGYKVIVASDLGGSYEQCPTTLLDFAKRDQRWCQGNLQHLQLVISSHLHPVSRVHMAMGVMSYVAAPLWLLFMLLSVVAVVVSPGVDVSEETLLNWELTGGPVITAWEQALLLFLFTMSLLLLPRVCSLLHILRQHDLVQAYGGELHVTVSVLMELVISALVAPILMLFHTRFVVSNLMGRMVQWSSQNRDESAVSLGEAVRNYWVHTLIGLGGLTLTYLFTPGLFPWLLPITGALAISIPLAMALSSGAIGGWLLRRRLLMIPEESNTPRVLRLQQGLIREALLRKSNEPDISPIERVVLDPTLHAMHLAILRSDTLRDQGKRYLPESELMELALTAKEQGFASLDRQQKLNLLLDEDALRSLNREAWETWPPSRLDPVVQGRGI